MASAKGGSGKTVLTVTLGTFLVKLGKKVLIADTDAATNGLSIFNLKALTRGKSQARADNIVPLGIYEVGPNVGSPYIIKLDTGVDMIPATYEFKNTEGLDGQALKDSLATTLSQIRGDYDYIFLDAQAGSDVYAQISLDPAISDEAIIVSEYDPVSAAGVERLKTLFKDSLNYERTWILLNKMLPEFVKSFSDFMEIVRYLAPIPWDAEVVRAFARRQVPILSAQATEYTLAIMRTLQTLLGEEIASDLKQWREDQTEMIRKPLDNKIKDTELEMQSFLKYKRDLQNNINVFKQSILTYTMMGKLFIAIPFLIVAGFFLSGIIFSPRILGTPGESFDLLVKRPFDWLRLFFPFGLGMSSLFILIYFPLRREWE